MALKKNEKMLVGLGLLVGGIALAVGLGLPQWDAFNATNSQMATLNSEIKGYEDSQTRLKAKLALLEKNTNIPAGFDIRTYTEQTKDAVIKQLLDTVVRMAADSGNKFISLTPYDAPPIMPPPAADTDAADKDKSGAQTGTQPATAAPTSGQSAEATPQAAPAGGSAPAASNADGIAQQSELPAPILTTHGYELAVRGTYDSLQDFLRSMRSQKELMEIAGINLENEVMAAQPGDSASLADPNYPIKLTVKLRMVLQPE